MNLELTACELDGLVARHRGARSRARRTKPRRRAACRAARRRAAMESDEARMRQVLVNLIGNALKFTERGEVVVRLDDGRGGRPNTWQVRDTGIGIPADRLDAIFNVFEQAEVDDRARYGGTGLGLAISRSLCELMGHHLDVQSVEGTGTTMTVVLGGRVRRMSRLRTPSERGAIAAPRATAGCRRARRRRTHGADRGRRRRCARAARPTAGRGGMPRRGGGERRWRACGWRARCGRR